MASRRFRDWDDDSNESSDSSENSAINNSSDRATNVFANDGSFLELFKKKMEEMQGTSDVKTNDETGNQNDVGDEASGIEVANSTNQRTQFENQSHQIKKVGKRRGGKILPTGMVKKARKEDMEHTIGTSIAPLPPERRGECAVLAHKPKLHQGESRSDAWSQYMKEVRKYKEQSCEDEGKRRPLVK